MATETSRQVCELYASRLAHVPLCSVKIDNLSFAGCSRGDIRGKTCNLIDTCKYSPGNSINIAGGYVSAYTCQRDNHRVLLLAIGVSILVLGLGVVIWNTVIQPQINQYRAIAREQKLLQKYVNLRAQAVATKALAATAPPKPRF